AEHGALTEVDVAVDLVAGANDVVPVHEVIADERAQARCDEIVELDFNARDQAELIGGITAHVGRLREEAAGEDAVGATGTGLGGEALDIDALMRRAKGELAGHIDGKALAAPVESAADLAAIKLIAGVEGIAL